MKKVEICVVCFGVQVDGVAHNDHDTITKMILLSRYSPSEIQVDKYVCFHCKKFLSEEEQSKLLVDEKETSKD
jgi:hypothetical protein